MTRILLVIVTAVALGVTGAALAARQTKGTQSIILQAGQAVGYGGLTCTAYAGTTATNAQIVCVRNNLRGFGVIVSQDRILVAKKTGSKIQVVFKTANK
jgi:hypothetical protein